ASLHRDTGWSVPIRQGNYSLPSSHRENSTSSRISSVFSSALLDTAFFPAFNRIIGQALPADALEQHLGALKVAVSEFDAVVVPEIELAHVSLEVFGAYVVERADQT